jgi:hypothetical protein
MIGDSISLTYNGGATVLTKINQDNYGAEYFLESGTRRFNMTIKHTIPARGKSGESHLVRLDVELYDANGVLLRTSSAWTVIRTDNGIHDQEECEDAAEALVAWLTAANITKVVGRQS